MGRKKKVESSPKVVFRHKKSDLFAEMTKGKTDEEIMAQFQLTYKRVWQIRKEFNEQINRKDAGGE